MNPIEFTVEINAAKETVWAVLWQDATFRLWAGIIDPGTYMIGELIEGKTVQFRSASGYGVTSLVARLEPNRCVEFWHQADTQKYGLELRDNQWSGGRETYILTEHEFAITLILNVDVPQELEAEMRQAYPLALQTIKQLAER